MNIALTPEQEQLIAGKVASGHYQSPSQVIEEGLRLLEAQDQILDLGLDRLREQIAVGLEQLRTGQGIPGEQVFREMHERSEHRRGAVR